MIELLSSSTVTGLSSVIRIVLITTMNENEAKLISKITHICVLGGLYVSSLDFESEKQYMITVMATDSGTPPLSNTAIVHINVTDANDNDPIFRMKTYSASVVENNAINEIILQVRISHMSILK